MKTKTKKSSQKSSESAQLSFWETMEPSAPNSKKRTKASSKELLSKINSEISFKVGEEILEQNFNPATWALALAHSNGSHEQSITQYARLRLESLADTSDYKRNKLRALEARRRSGFQQIKSPTPPPYSGNLALHNKTNRARIRLSPIWLAGFWIGAAGALASATRYFAETYGMNIQLGPTNSVGIAASLVSFIVILHLTMPTLRNYIRHLVPVCAWSAACVSLFCGIMVLRGSATKNTPIIASVETSNVRTILPEVSPKSDSISFSPIVEKAIAQTP